MKLLRLLKRTLCVWAPLIKTCLFLQSYLKAVGSTSEKSPKLKVNKDEKKKIKSKIYRQLLDRFLGKTAVQRLTGVKNILISNAKRRPKGNLSQNITKMEEIYFRMQLKCYLGYSRCVSNRAWESVKLDTHFLKSVGFKSMRPGQDAQ